MADNRACAFCGKPEGEVARLHAGPRALICDECVVLCREIFAEEERRDEPRKKSPAASLACSFCGRNRDDVTWVVAGPTVFICDGCVAGFDREAS